MTEIKLPSSNKLTQLSDAKVSMRLQVFSFKIETQAAPEFIDLTELTKDCVGKSGILNGSITIFSKHTTAAIKINENEPLLIQDMEKFLERIAPRDGDYLHNDFTIRTVNMTEDECPNGHAHCQHLMLGTSESVPIVDGRLMFGQWQRVFFIELDMPRRREVVVQVMGV